MNKAVFIEREGIITDVSSNAKSIRILNDLNYKVFIVTNQAGVSLGYLSENELVDEHIRLIEQLLDSADAQIDDIAYCPHHPDANCHCRKPKPTMILELAYKHRVDLQQSFSICENGADLVAGRLAGTRTILIIDKEEIIPVVDVDNVVFSLEEAVAWIVEVSQKSVLLTI